MQRQTGSITYELTLKNVKNINLRITRDGKIIVSAPLYADFSYIDKFVLSKSSWIEQALGKIRPPEDVSFFTDEECLEYFQGICDRIVPLFDGKVPNDTVIKVKNLKSCWGICHPFQNYITFNKSLMLKPLPAVEYVVLHEYVHFLVPGHGKRFYDILKKLMPDYKYRKSLLQA